MMQNYFIIYDLSTTIVCPLSRGQTDSQVVASSGKLNLRRDLRWVAKRTGKFPRKCTKVAKKNISRLRAQSRAAKPHVSKQNGGCCRQEKESGCFGFYFIMLVVSLLW